MQHGLSAPNPFKRVWSAYERQLHRSPIATQATTSFLLWGFGDYLAQRLERMSQEAGAPAAAAAASAAAHPSGQQLQQQAKQARSSEVPAAAGAASGAGAGTDGQALDMHRLLWTALFGAVLVGPVGHFWYQNIDKWCSKLFARNTAQFIAAKVIVDTAAMGPFYVAAFFAWGAAFIDRTGWDDFTNKMRTDFVPTLAAEVCIWPIVQTINFWKVPVDHQLLVVNVGTIADACFMSWARNQDDWLGKLLADVHGGKQA